MSIKRYDIYGARESEDGPYVYYQDHVSELARLMERCMDGGVVWEVLIEDPESCTTRSIHATREGAVASMEEYVEADNAQMAQWNKEERLNRKEGEYLYVHELWAKHPEREDAYKRHSGLHGVRVTKTTIQP